VGEKRAPEADAAAFLTGDAATHAEIRRAIGAVVKCFRVGAPATVEELIQESHYRVFLSLRTGAFRGEASLRTFSQKVAEYTCLEHMRRARFKAEVHPAALPEPRAASEPESILLRAEEHRGNLHRLAAMPPECRELFRMIFIERLSYVEVARRCGISETAVKLRVHRCRLGARATGASGKVAEWRPGRKEVRD
jgi:RNA polymerase sigma-70 factor (ECF subfamily)